MANADSVEGGGGQGVWSSAQLAGLARDAGFSESESLIAASIALAESGGNPNAHNGKAPDDSYGLWQINMRGSLGPARRKQFGIASNSALYDPATNAKAAHMVYKSQGWGAWTTYKGSKQVGYLAKIKAAVKGAGTIAGWIGTAGPSAASGAAGAATDQFAGIAGSITDVGKNIFKGIATVQAVVVALVFVILGIVLLAKGELIKPVKGVAKGLLK